MKETFKPIEEFNGAYLVSNLGRVKSLNYGGTKSAQFLKPIKHHGGYLVVHLSKDGKVYNRMIHSLVAKAFIPNTDCKRIVNHIDGDKHNNVVSNLEWVTYKENSLHAQRLGLRDPHKNNIPKGKDNFHSKPILQYSKEGTFIKEWGCISDAARHVGCNPCMITNNAAGRTKSAHGYVWRYPNEA